MSNCFHCEGHLNPSRLRCDRCGIEVSGRFETSRLARLSGADQQLAEALLLSGGNLKEVAEALAVSYPTLRKRVDRLIESLTRLREQDQSRAGEMLNAVERGELQPEEVARRLGEMGGGH